MGTENFLIFAFTNIFRIFVNKRFLGLFLDKKSGKRSRLLCALAVFTCFMLTSAGYILFRNPNVNIITNVIGLFLIALTFDGNIRQRLLVTCIVYFFNMICDVIVVLSCSGYRVRTSINELVGTMTVLFITICQIVIEKVVLIRKKMNFLSPYWYLLLIIPLLSMGMIHFLIGMSLEEHLIILIVGSCLLIINFVSFFLYGTMEDAYLNNIENTSLLQTYKNYKYQLEIIMDSQEQIRSLQHDMKYHLRDLLAMAKDQNMSEMTAYLEEMNQLIVNPNEHVYSGNKEIDSNLNYLLSGAKQKLKNVSVKLAIPEGEYVASIDINIILSNLLDNAITAAERTEEKYLRLEMFEKQNLLYISVENSYDGTVQEENGVFLTTKRDSSLHGYGLKNVRRIVKKYDGTLRIHHNETRFFVDVMLYLSDTL